MFPHDQGQIKYSVQFTYNINKQAYFKIHNIYTLFNTTEIFF